MKQPTGYIILITPDYKAAFYQYYGLREVTVMWNDFPTHAWECALVHLCGDAPASDYRNLVFDNDVARYGGIDFPDAVTNLIIEKSRCVAFWEALAFGPIERAKRELQVAIEFLDYLYETKATV